MMHALVIGSELSALRLARPVLVALLLVACTTNGGDPAEETVLVARSGKTGIQVTEATEDGQQVVRVTTSFRGEESTVVLHIDEPVYEVEIPLSINQQGPAGESLGTGIEALLAAQYLEKAQEAMLDGDYNGALRHVNLVLAVQPDHIRALMMKGSAYYAMGNYQLANEQWEGVLAIDPSNEEVLQFQEFVEFQQPTDAPDLPLADPGGIPVVPGISPDAPDLPLADPGEIPVIPGISPPGAAGAEEP